MLTQDFCEYLEYYLTETLFNSKDLDRRRCWCDGIILPEDDKIYSLEAVSRSKRILTHAVIDEGRIKGGERGQFIYQLTIMFGEKALEFYSHDFDLTEGLYSVENDDWVLFDREKKEIELQLL